MGNGKGILRPVKLHDNNNSSLLVPRVKHLAKKGKWLIKNLTKTIKEKELKIEILSYKLLDFTFISNVSFLLII
jgi:hypothetical protein